MRRARFAVFVFIVPSLLLGCTTGVATDSTESIAPTSDAQVTFTSVVDGDTIETSAGTVRVIGIDAPESGACGYDEAAAHVSSLLVEGDSAVLDLPDGQNDQDQYGRLLRYVETTQGIDVGLSLLTAGLAVARYNSTDGYPAHPREAQYQAAQVATIASDGTVTTVACKAAADAAEQARIAPEQQAAPAQPSAAAPDWWTQFTSCTKLKKNDAGYPVGPFSRDNPTEAVIYEWFANGTGNNGDGEGDGLACE